jgi:hypothetical protein
MSCKKGHFVTKLSLRCSLSDQTCFFKAAANTSFKWLWLVLDVITHDWLLREASAAEGAEGAEGEEGEEGGKANADARGQNGYEFFTD